MSATNKTPKTIDGRPVVSARNDDKGFTVFAPVRDPSDLSKGVSQYPHIRVNDNGSAHFSDLVVHPTDPDKFGDKTVRMQQFSLDLSTAKQQVVDARTRVSTEHNALQHRTQGTLMSPSGSVSPRTQTNTAARFTATFDS